MPTAAMSEPGAPPKRVRDRLAPGLSLRLRLLVGFCALSVFTLGLGVVAVHGVGRSGAVVAAIFDRALISTS